MRIFETKNRKMVETETETESLADLWSKIYSTAKYVIKFLNSHKVIFNMTVNTETNLTRYFSE